MYCFFAENWWFRLLIASANWNCIVFNNLPLKYTYFSLEIVLHLIQLDINQSSGKHPGVADDQLNVATYWKNISIIFSSTYRFFPCVFDLKIIYTNNSLIPSKLQITIFEWGLVPCVPSLRKNPNCLFSLRHGNLSTFTLPSSVLHLHLSTIRHNVNTRHGWKWRTDPCARASRLRNAPHRHVTFKMSMCRNIQHLRPNIIYTERGIRNNAFTLCNILYNYRMLSADGQSSFSASTYT